MKLSWVDSTFSPSLLSSQKVPPPDRQIKGLLWMRKNRHLRLEWGWVGQARLIPVFSACLTACQLRPKTPLEGTAPFENVMPNKILIFIQFKEFNRLMGPLCISVHHSPRLSWRISTAIEALVINHSNSNFPSTKLLKSFCFQTFSLLFSLICYECLCRKQKAVMFLNLFEQSDVHLPWSLAWFHWRMRVIPGHKIFKTQLHIVCQQNQTKAQISLLTVIFISFCFVLSAHQLVSFLQWSKNK